MDRVVPADEYVEDVTTNIDQNDVDNYDKMQDDKFDNVEIVAQKDMEIEKLIKNSLKESTR